MVQYRVGKRVETEEEIDIDHKIIDGDDVDAFDGAEWVVFSRRNDFVVYFHYMERNKRQETYLRKDLRIFAWLHMKKEN
ncbi:hypothetical protein LXL04_014892 [Taraxacum kok-saghyz]